jgi:hypothetical protein
MQGSRCITFFDNRFAKLGQKAFDVLRIVAILAAPNRTSCSPSGFRTAFSGAVVLTAIRHRPRTPARRIDANEFLRPNRRNFPRGPQPYQTYTQILQIVFARLGRSKHNGKRTAVASAYLGLAVAPHTVNIADHFAEYRRHSPRVILPRRHRARWR